MKSTKTTKLITMLLIILVSLTACEALPANGETADILTASGVVEAVEVAVAPELGGRVAEVFASEGDEVEAGMPLFRLEDDLLNAQRAQAVAAHETALANLAAAQANLAAANATVEAAEVGVHAAEVDYEIALLDARLEEQDARVAAWADDPPDEFVLPAWYFEKPEEIAAAESELESASDALDIERENFSQAVADASNDDLLAAETRLAEAQAAFLVAEELLNREIASSGRDEISDYIQDIYDTAKAELEAAQLDYDQMLSDQAYEDVLEARARLSVAEERYELALDRLNGFFIGEESLTLQSFAAVVMQAEAGVAQAEANVALAEAAVTQAEAVVNEAQAALNVFDAQIAKLTVHASVSGVLMVRNVEPGEILTPGMAALTIARLDDLTITVYIPEDQYGNIHLGDNVKVTADSFPGQTFSAEVIRIADRAEYTPRNVQTQEDRSTTVYAIELSVSDSDGKFKPGMPVDVEISQ